MKILLINCILTLLSFNLFAQTTVAGHVLTTNGNPIPYASISINESTGTITNENGDFKLKLHHHADTLLTRCIGYESKAHTINSKNEFQTIILSPISYELDDITISPIDVEKLVREASKKIKKNYPKDIKLYGEYRQVSLSDGEYKGVFRSDINAYINGFNKSKPSHVETEVINHEFYLSDTSRAFVSEKALLKTMCVSYKHFILLNNAYSFAYEGKFFSDNREIIKVSFKPQKVDTKKTQVKGFMFIDSDTKGFIYFDYSLVSKEDEFSTYKKTKQRRTGYNVKISYTEDSDYYTVNYAIVSHQNDIMLDNGTISNHYSIFNFFSKPTRVNHITHSSTANSVSDILKQSKGETFSESKHKIEDYIVESDEALDFKRSIK